MIEPRAWMDANGNVMSADIMQQWCDGVGSDLAIEYKTPLTTVADVLAALREPSEAMIEAATQTGVDCDACIRTQYSVSECFLAMLDQFEKEQSSPAKKAYEAANPLGGPARMFDAIADRIRAGEEYYSVLADYGVTVGAK